MQHAQKPNDGTKTEKAAKGSAAAFALLGLGIVIILGGGIWLEVALSHQRGPSAARAANRNATALSPADAAAPQAPGP